MKHAVDGKKLTKAIKAGLLAVDAERQGREAEALQAGLTAGRVAWAAGATTDDLYAGVASTYPVTELAWNYMVDGWYEAAGPTGMPKADGPVYGRDCGGGPVPVEWAV